MLILTRIWKNMTETKYLVYCEWGEVILIDRCVAWWILNEIQDLRPSFALATYIKWPNSQKQYYVLLFQTTLWSICQKLVRLTKARGSIVTGDLRDILDSNSSLNPLSGPRSHTGELQWHVGHMYYLTTINLRVILAWREVRANVKRQELACGFFLVHVNITRVPVAPSLTKDIFRVNDLYNKWKPPIVIQYSWA